MKALTAIALLLLTACSFRPASSSSAGMQTNAGYTNDTSAAAQYAWLTNLPVLAFGSPTSGASVYGVCTIAFTALSASTDFTMTLTLKGSNLAITNTGSTYDGTNHILSWSSSLDTTALGDGWYPVIAMANLTNGLKASNALTLKVDNAGRKTAIYPSATLTNAGFGSYLTNPSFTFRGTASVSAGKITNLTLTVSNGQSFTNLRIPTNSSAFLWSQTLDLSPFGEGPFSLRLVAESFDASSGVTNSTNNLATAGFLPLAADLSNPVLSVDASGFSTNIRRSFWTLSASASDAGSGISLVTTELSNSAGVFPNALASEGSTNFPFTDTFPLRRGTNLLRVRAYDLSGRQSAESVKTLVAGDSLLMDNGTEDFEAATESFASDSSRTTWMTWDADWIYFGFGAEDMRTNNKVFYAAINTNTATGNAKAPYDKWDTGSTVWLGFGANLVYSFRGTNGAAADARKIVWDGSAWGPGSAFDPSSNGGSYSVDASADASGYVTSGFGKYKVSRAALGNPSRILLSTWARNLDDSNNPGWGWYFGANPASEAGPTSAWDGINDRHQPRWIDITFADGLAPNDASRLKSARTPHTVAADGVNDFFPQYEKFAAGDGKTGYFTWDANSLYFGFESENFSAENKAFYVAVSTNTNAGTNASPYGQWFEGSAVNLPYKIQHFFVFKRTNSTEERYQWTSPGSSWTGTNRYQPAGLGSYCTPTYSEFSISRNNFGNPAGKIWLSFWSKDLSANGGWGWFFGNCPGDTNAGGINDRNQTKWIEVDLGVASVPNAAANIKP